MTYIRCPECGQKALSVATRCPKCGLVLSQNPMISGGVRGLVECRHCHKLIQQGVQACPYCGHSAWWDARRLTGAAIIAVAVVVVGAGVWFLAAQVGGGSRSGGGAPEPQRTVPPAPAVASSITLVPRDTAAVRDTVPPISELPALQETDSARRRQAPAPPETAEDLAPVPVSGPTGSLVVRWTSNWVNLRRGPGIAYTVLDVFRPGRRIEVGRPRGGWWPVYDDGVMVGYVSGSELSTVPPDN